MTEIQAQQAIDHTTDNILPFPATTATDADGNHEEIKLYTADELKQVFAPDAQTSRTVRDLVAKVREAYHWLEEIEFKRGEKFTQFTFDQIKTMKESGLTQKQWIAEIQKLAPEPEIEPLQEVQQSTPVEGEFVLDAGVLALYNQAQEQGQQKASGNSGLNIYFKPEEYQNRYQSAEVQLGSQFNAEVNFANELLARCAEMALDNQAWDQAEQQKQDANQRQAAIRGMERALNEFMNENTAYRGLKTQLENGQITPEQVMALMQRLQKPQGTEGNAHAQTASSPSS